MRRTSYVYPDPNTRIEYTDLNTVGDQGLRTDTLYDALGRVRAQRTYENRSTYIETTTSYDPLGRVASRTNPSRPGDNLAFSTQYTYDALGRLVQTTQTDGSVISNSYLGPSTTVRDEAGATRILTYDALGRLANVREDPNGANLPTGYQYDALDDLTLVTQGSCGNPYCQQRAFIYDGLGRLLQTNNPENGIAHYDYDKAGNLLHKVDARQIVITYSYDVGNRLTGKSSSDGTVNTTWTYDEGANATGRLTKVVSNTAGSTTSYAYDSLGRVTGSTQSTGGNNYSLVTVTIWLMR